MIKDKNFALRLSSEDLATLEKLASHLKRSRSDTIRWSVAYVAELVNNHPEQMDLGKE